jgi:hypothetical protein
VDKQRTCIFDGGSPVTSTHVFRKAWLRDHVFPGADGFDHRHVRTGDQTFDQSWKTSNVDIKVNATCAACNSGWMNDLDLEAEEILLTHAATGYNVKLTKLRDVEVVARWCCLVAVLLDQILAEPILSAETQKDVYRGAIPQGTGIWLLQARPPLFGISGWASPRELDLTPRDSDQRSGRAYHTTFGVNHFVCQVFMRTDNTPDDVTFQRESSAMRQLWPNPMVPFYWPPPQVLSEVQIEDLKSRMFDGPG